MLCAAQRKSRVRHTTAWMQEVEQCRSNCRDNITKDHYATHLDANLDNLVERLHKMAYKPQPVLRIYIPKAGSQRKRPLGIPTLEDKLVQAGVVG